MNDSMLTELAELYRDLHAHPELSFEETRTAGIIAEKVRAFGYAVTEGVGKTGVVAVLERGEGATVLLRADMDGLPVEERTGLAYASTARSGESPIMHACGHDMHVTALIGALGALASQPNWSGKIIAVFQPAEEIGAGARAMVDDGLFDRFGTPDVVLGQHVAPMPAGALGVRAGVSFAASDALRVTLYGRGGHGSRPETTVDPIVLAAAVVLRLQTIVSREIAATDVAVVTIGALHAGDAGNIIPDSAELRLSIRTFDEAVRQRVLAAVERIVRAEALAAGADREPLIETLHSFPAVRNDEAAIDRVSRAFGEHLPALTIVDPGAVTGSEDVGILALESGAECAYWILGGADPALFAEAGSMAELAAIAQTLPSNHSPLFAPAIDPTLRIGVGALTVAARAWLAPQDDSDRPASAR